MLTCLLPAMAGLNIIAGMAMIDSLSTMSFEQFVLDDEIVGITKRILRGIDLDDEKIAADLIKSTGPGGSFLGTKHSLKHFREELWIPQISDRTTWSQWHERGEKKVEVRAREYVKKTLESHKPPPLSADAERTVWNIVREAQRTRAKA